MSGSSSAAASSSSFHFSAQGQPPLTSSPLHSPISTNSPASTSPPPIISTSPTLLLPATHTRDDPSSPLYYPQQQPTRPSLSSSGNSYASNGMGTVDALQRRVSYGGQQESDSIWGATRTVRAGSDGQLLGGNAPREVEGDAYEQERAALFREHERRSLENSANSRLANAYLPPLTTANAPLPPPSHFQQQPQPQQHLLASLPAILSPTSPTPTSLGDLQGQAHALAAGGEGRFESASLHLGDLDVWMDEAYVRECCARMGWEGVTNIKMIRGASPSSGYCFLTFPSAAHAAQVLARFAASPPMLMPRSARTFKLNWGTGLPGVQPRWEGEYSVFVGDLGREVGEAELVALFTPLFPSTKSAKIMYDPSTGISRGYGFVRFADDSDMQRALLLGQNAGSGLSLHGRTLRISEASGPGNAVDGNGRERTRSRSSDPLSIQTGGPYHSYQPQQHPGSELSPTPNYPDFLSPTFPSPYAPAHSPVSYNSHTPSMAGRGPMGQGYGGHQQHPQQSHHQSNPAPHTTDPNNTTVFVGGLPACISEETLKSFFHHFGEITYCKIPTGKGCGFVQFVRRADAELAIAKMNDFPIHGKSRIRLSWGRSQLDKQGEHVRKLASALGVPFEAVWRMVQGQDNTTIKQIATAVGGPPVLSGRFESLGVGRMELGAVASAAGLTEAEVLELVGGRASLADGYSGVGTSNSGRSESDFFARSSGLSGSVVSGDTSHSGGGGGGNGPYSRVSPSSFSAFSGTRGPPQSLLPLSPPPSAGLSPHNQMEQQQEAHYARASPYSSIRAESYLVQSPSSPYGRVDFAEGGVPHGGAPRPNDRYQYSNARQPPQPQYQDPHQAYQMGYEQPHQQQHHVEQAYTTMARPTSLEESFGGLSFSQPPPAPSRANSSGFPSALGNANLDDSRPRSYVNQAGLGGGVEEASLGNGGAQWGAWNGVRDVQA